MCLAHLDLIWNTHEVIPLMIDDLFWFLLSNAIGMCYEISLYFLDLLGISSLLPVQFSIIAAPLGLSDVHFNCFVFMRFSQQELNSFYLFRLFI